MEKFKIKKFANRVLYSDIIPFEVVRVVSTKCVEIRRMKVTPTHGQLPQTVGGFVTNFGNEAQNWIIESDDEKPTFKIRLNKDGWKCAGGGDYRMNDIALQYYDFNF